MKRKIEPTFFFFLIKISFRNNVLPEVEEEVTWCSGVPLVRKLHRPHQKTGLIPDCKDLMLEEEFFIYAA